MFRKIILSAAAVALMVCVLPPDSFAVQLPGFSSPKPAPASGNAEAMQAALVVHYRDAATSVATAQLELAKAFDLKDQAAELDAEVTALKSGAVLDKSAVEKNEAASDDASKAIDAKIDSGADLSAEGKQHYQASLAPFASGLLITTKMPPELKAFSESAKAQISSASMLDKMKVTSKFAVGMHLATELPGHTSRLMDSFNKIVTYAKSHSIPVPDDAQSVLGSG